MNTQKKKSFCAKNDRPRHTHAAQKIWTAISSTSGGVLSTKQRRRARATFLFEEILLLNTRESLTFVIRWWKHTPLAWQVATGRDAGHSSPRCSRNDRGVRSPARSKWEGQTFRASRVPPRFASEVFVSKSERSECCRQGAVRKAPGGDGENSWREGTCEKGREREINPPAEI